MSRVGKKIVMSIHSIRAQYKKPPLAVATLSLFFYIRGKGAKSDEFHGTDF